MLGRDEAGSRGKGMLVMKDEIEHPERKKKKSFKSETILETLHSLSKKEHIYAPHDPET